VGTSSILSIISRRWKKKSGCSFLKREGEQSKKRKNPLPQRLKEGKEFPSIYNLMRKEGGKKKYNILLLGKNMAAEEREKEHVLVNKKRGGVTPF